MVKQLSDSENAHPVGVPSDFRFPDGTADVSGFIEVVVYDGGYNGVKRLLNTDRIEWVETAGVDRTLITLQSGLELRVSMPYATVVDLIGAARLT